MVQPPGSRLQLFATSLFGHGSFPTHKFDRRPTMYHGILPKPRGTLWTHPIRLTAIATGIAIATVVFLQFFLLCQNIHTILRYSFNVALDEVGLRPILLLVAKEPCTTFFTIDADRLVGVDYASRFRFSHMQRGGGLVRSSFGSG
jgi:hypothetical protein